MSNQRLLIAYAHPDDEAFGLGALIAKYVKQGTQVDLICATNGDVGTVKPEFLNGYNSIAELRLAELDCAAQKLGFTNVIKFGYKDSGMMGSETSHDPDCLWHAWQTQPDTVIRRVVEVIRELKPQVVITFNKYGGYGHPDHIAIQRATTAAFTRAANPDFVTDQPPYAPTKLYYSSIPSLMLRIGIAFLRLQGKNPRQMGENKDIDLRAILDHVEPAHARIDIRDYLDDWDAASACHASQVGGRGFRLPATLRRMLSTGQTFTRVYPAPARNRIDETDLFAGVIGDPVDVAVRL